MKNSVSKRQVVCNKLLEGLEVSDLPLKSKKKLSLVQLMYGRMSDSEFDDFVSKGETPDVIPLSPAEMAAISGGGGIPTLSDIKRAWHLAHEVAEFVLKSMNDLDSHNRDWLDEISIHVRHTDGSAKRFK
jgi:hypothetical protein